MSNNIFCISFRCRRTDMGHFARPLPALVFALAPAGLLRVSRGRGSLAESSESELVVQLAFGGAFFPETQVDFDVFKVARH